MEKGEGVSICTKWVPLKIDEKIVGRYQYVHICTNSYDISRGAATTSSSVESWRRNLLPLKPIPFPSELLHYYGPDNEHCSQTL